MGNDYKEPDLEPFSPSLTQKGVADYLDNLNQCRQFFTGRLKPSKLVMGGLKVMHKNNRTDDWMAQSAHSFREVFLFIPSFENNLKQEKKNFISRIFFSVMSRFQKRLGEQKYKSGRIAGLFVDLHDQEVSQEIGQRLVLIERVFTKISHHFGGGANSEKDACKILKKLGIKTKNGQVSEKAYLKLVDQFFYILKQASLDPLSTHKKIDEMVKTSEKNNEYINLLFSQNIDAKAYFFSRVDETWFDWLVENNFFSSLSSVDNVDFNLPELDYLSEMAGKYPEGVARVIDDKGDKDNFKLDNFNPAIVGRFLWIMSKLPAEQIARLVTKVHREGWMKNPEARNRSGYEFSEMVEKLAEAKRHDALIELAEAMLEVKELDERQASEFMGHVSYDDSPFYLSDITQSRLFEKLLEVDDDHKMRALTLCGRILEKVIKQSGREPGHDFFAHGDPVFLGSEDLFEIDLENISGYRSDADIKNLVTVTLKIARDLLASNTINPEQIIKKLPDKTLSHLVWRMYFVLLSQKPKVFSDELEKMFFKVFEVENTYDVQGGPEYENALKIAFAEIQKKEEYLEKVFEYFPKRHKKSIDDGKEEKWHLRNGWEILSSVPQEFLLEDDKDRCKGIFGSRPDETYHPEPNSSKVQSVYVQPRSPVDVFEMDVSDIFAKIKTEWTPEKLKEEYKNDDFLRPRGVEGLGDALKDDIQKRLSEYAQAFLGEDKLEEFAPHYVYSMMRGLEDMSRNGQGWSKEEIDQLFDVFIKIVDLCKENKLFQEVGEEDSWLARWVTVHKPIADSLLQILHKKDLNIEKIKERAYKLLHGLLSVPDPIAKHEDPEYGDLYHIAINSVRGRAFEAFTVFVEKEGKELGSEAKDLYEKVLKDDSLAVRFVMGRYLASYYFRDKKFIKDRLDEIFPKDGNKELFFAAWGGYLSNSLYKDLFDIMEPYYKHVIHLVQGNYPEREYVRDHTLDKALAIHMALAFAHLDYGYEGDGIVAEFWEHENKERFAEFISFIGRSLLTKSDSSREFLKEQKVEKDRLIDFWKWVLKEKAKMAPDIFGGFGFWINPDKEIISDGQLLVLVEETLKLGNGACDWESGLIKRLPVWAEGQNPEIVISVIKNYLIVDEGLNNQNRYPLVYKEHIKDAIEILYRKKDEGVKKGVEKLVDELIDAGGRMFWFLEDIEDEQGDKLINNVK